MRHLSCSSRARLGALAVLAMLTLPAGSPTPAHAQAVIEGDASAPGKPMSDRLYGIFFEDINHAADGGLYAELVQNRSFEFNSTDNGSYNGLTAWSRVDRGGAAGTLAVASADPLNAKNLNYLRLTTRRPPPGRRTASRSATAASTPASTSRPASATTSPSGPRRDGTADLPVRVAVEDAAGATEYAAAAVDAHGRRLEEVHGRADRERHDDRRAPGRDRGRRCRRHPVDLDMVSLFPQDTFKGRENGHAQGPRAEDRRPAARVHALPRRLHRQQPGQRYEPFPDARARLPLEGHHRPGRGAPHQRELLGLQPELRPGLLRVLPVRRGPRRGAAAGRPGRHQRLRRDNRA